MVGDPELCKAASRPAAGARTASISSRSTIPTVARGTERLRITPTPFHDDALIAGLADSSSRRGSTSALPLDRAGTAIAAE